MSNGRCNFEIKRSYVKVKLDGNWRALRNNPFWPGLANLTQLRLLLKSGPAQSDQLTNELPKDDIISKVRRKPYNVLTVIATLLNKNKFS